MQINKIEEKFNKIAKNYDIKRTTKEYDKRIKRIISSAKPKQKDKVIDLGCGTGALTIPIAEIVGKQGKVYGVDVSKEMLKIAAKKLDSHGLTNTKLIKSNIAELSFRNNSINLIVSHNMFHYLSNEEKYKTLIKCHKILTKNGRIVIADVVFLNTLQRILLFLKITFNMLSSFKIKETLLFLANVTSGCLTSLKEYPLNFEQWEDLLENVGFTKIKTDKKIYPIGIIVGRKS